MAVRPMDIGKFPVLESERLRLRVQRLDDFAASLAMWSSPDVVRYISGKASTRQESWTRLLRNVGHWVLMGYGFWAVEERRGGAFLGEVGFGNFERELEPSLDGIPEIGWVLSPSAHGRGFATEAVAAAVAWADAHLEHRRTACIISPMNEPSIRVARRNGYREWTRTTYRDEPTILFERPRDG